MRKVLGMAFELDQLIADSVASETAFSDLDLDLEAALVKSNLLASVVGEHGSAGIALGRFQVLRCIGRGGMGKVFEARDRHTGARLALKTLYERDGAALARIKREFRALANLSHRNLVAMYELHLVRGLPFFTMELVDGSSLAEHLRDERSVAVTFIRRSLSQLLDALTAIHANRTVHGDIKPSNLLLRQDGTLILVDFGVARTLGETRAVSGSGTSAYMAPERIRGESAEPPSDWYAVGVVLRQLLECFEAESSDPHRQQLANLCAGLLDPNPALRFGAHEVAAALDSAPACSVSGQLGDGVFVAREAELTLLQRVLQSSVLGPRVCAVSGDPGLGKTALVEHFLDSLGGAESVVFTGRCFEHEALPYKGFDSIVEELAVYLRSLPATTRTALIPPDTSDLLQVFPALKSAISADDTRCDPTRDPRAIRRQAFSSLASLLSAVAEQHQLILFIDDLQWGDADAAALLEHLLLGPEQPALLLIATYRSTEPGPCVTVLNTASCSCVYAALTLRPLEPRACAELARRLSVEPLTEAAQASLMHESAGSPLVLRALLQSGPGVPSATTRTFEELVTHTLDRLGSEAREVLKLTVLAGRPVGSELLRVAARTVEPPWKPIAALRNGRLLRTLARDGQLCVLPHHDRVSETVLRALGPDERRARHAALAEAAQALALDDPEFFAEQHFRAGALVEAAAHAELAADRARDAVALKRACELYVRALECLEPKRPLHIVRKLAEAHGAAGDLARAAPLYLEAATAQTQDGWQLRLNAAEMYLLSGAQATGMKLLGPALRQAGIWLPTSTQGALALGLLSFVRTQLAMRVRLDSARPPDRRAEIAFRLGYSIVFMNPQHGAALLLWSGARALRHGSQAQRGRALGYTAYIYALIGLGSASAQQRMIADALALTTGDRVAHAFVLCCDALVSFARFECADVLRKLEAAQTFILAKRVEERWLLIQLQTIAASVRVASGDFIRLDAFAAVVEREADELGNQPVIVQARSARAWAALVAGDPGVMRNYARAARQEWKSEQLSTLYGIAVWGECHALLYEGDTPAAVALMRVEAPRFVRSGVARTQPWSAALTHLWACVELSSSTRTGDAHWRAAEALVRRLEREQPPWAAACAALIRAGLARRKPDRIEAMREYACARELFERAGMNGYAAAAAYRTAQLHGSTAPPQDAVPWFASQSVAEPDKWTRMYAP